MPVWNSLLQECCVRFSVSVRNVADHGKTFWNEVHKHNKAQNRGQVNMRLYYHLYWHNYPNGFCNLTIKRVLFSFGKEIQAQKSLWKTHPLNHSRVNGWILFFQWCLLRRAWFCKDQCWGLLLKKVTYYTLHITLKNTLHDMISPWRKQLVSLLVTLLVTFLLLVI